MVRDTWLDQNVPVRARVVRIQVWGFRFGFNISEEGAGVRVQVRLNFLRGFRFGLRIGFGGSVPLRVGVQAGENSNSGSGSSSGSGSGGSSEWVRQKAACELPSGSQTKVSDMFGNPHARQTPAEPPPPVAMPQAKVL